jgi:3-deoxy-D-manno-octulosonic-acid transferase
MTCSVDHLDVVPVPAAVRLRRAAFRVLEMLGDAREWLKGRRPPAPRGKPLPTEPGPGGYLWVFASTIGELNAIEPLLRRLIEEAGCPPLLLISDREHYRDSYIERYPAARFAALDGRSGSIRSLMGSVPPCMLIIAEIPCLLSDAPCRLPSEVVYRLKRSRLPVCLVNGWLYHYPPSCLRDRLERQLLGRAYVQMIDLFLVQNDGIRQRLIDEGARPERVVVTGNIKFDALTRPALDWQTAASATMLRSIRDSDRPSLVAGCVTDPRDQSGLLDAIHGVLKRDPRALLVLAPRHPEISESMARLESFLEQRGLSYLFRSRVPDAELDPGVQVLVLDTIGELKYFYSVGDLAYVGANHNVLEPLSFSKPVLVLPGWEPTYPSYPVYRSLLERGVITEVRDHQALGREWIGRLHDPGRSRMQQEKLGSVLQASVGATDKALEMIGHLRAAASHTVDARRLRAR